MSGHFGVVSDGRAKDCSYEETFDEISTGVNLHLPFGLVNDQVGVARGDH